MAQKVIVQFNNFTDRDRWASKLNTKCLRVYKRNPWLAAELSNDQVRQLEQQEGVKISPDVQMSPAVKV
jgi:hypothetical protein